LKFNKEEKTTNQQTLFGLAIIIACVILPVFIAGIMLPDGGCIWSL